MNKQTNITSIARPVNRALGPAAFAATIALGVWSCNAALAGQATQGHAQYRPVQSVSYEFGSKFASGYFLREAGKCLVTLMVTEKSNPEQTVPLTAARVRLILNAGQIAGLDSEEGQSLNFTCSAGAEALFVNAGERDTLIAIQNNALSEAVRQAKLP